MAIRRKSAKKSFKQSVQRAALNKSKRENIKFLLKSFEKSIAANDREKAKELVLKIQKFIDKSVKNKILKKNTASRRKSSLMRKFNLAFAKKK